MKRMLGLLLAILLTVTSLGGITEAKGESKGTLVLPSKLTKVGEEAFAGDSRIKTVMIPKTIQEIGSRAFADCKNLKEVYIGKSSKLKIKKDAFNGCKDVEFFVYAGTPGEMFALTNGFRCTLLEPDSDALNRAMKLVAEGGGASFLQSGTYATKRLIVQRKENQLPNISSFSPKSIMQKADHIYFLQFDTVKDTEACYTLLVNDPDTIFVEPDEWVDPLDIISSNGTVDVAVWKTDDPMGFAQYAPYVKQNGKGKVTIAVVDSGVSIHSSYKSILRSDGINVLEALDGEKWSTDSARHGSVIASVIKDCVGNNSVNILPVRVVGADGKADSALIAEGIDYAVEKNAKIINLSLNFPRSAIVEYSINKAVKAGVTVVVAAGNDGRNISGIFPANMSNVVTVTGIGPDYKLHKSNYGAGVDYCAPASYILTTAFSGSHEGTSFAAPMIASAYALVSLDPNHSLADLKASCRMGADDGSLEKSSAYGSGMPMLNKLSVIAPTGITLDSGIPQSMKTGDKAQVKWNVTPANADNQNVVITSSNTAAVTVSTENGNTYVNAVGAGTSTITATISGTSISAQVTITVVQPVTGLQITGASSTLIMGNTMQLGVSITPSNATNKSVRWVSTNTAVATVSDTGLVTPVGAGTAGIYVAAKDGYGARSSTVNITVITIPPATSVTLKMGDRVMNDQTLTLATGGTAQLTATVLPAQAIQSVTYDSYPTGVVTVSGNGLITAVAAGQTVVTARASTGNNVIARLTVKVTVVPTAVTIGTPSKTTLDVGEAITLTATVSPSNATDKSVRWTSSNSAVATVSNGLVTAVAPGTTTITVTTNSGGKTASVMITVRQPYTLFYDAAGGTVSPTSKTAYSGYEVGALPTPTRDYYSFLGWFTAKDGGTAVTSATKLTGTGTVTIYAHWQLKPEKGWVTESSVPAGAQITQTSWSYRESTESTSSSMSGWISNGSYWSQTGSGSQDYASFPSTFNTSNTYYQNMHNKQVQPYENESSKREVTNRTGTGYIYWHWMYNVAYANNTKRTISDRKGTFNPSGGTTGSNAYAYKYFYAIKSTVNCPYLDKYYCCSRNQASYNCVSIIPSNADKSSTSGLGTPRFFRFAYNTSDYTDYTKMYRYYRDLQYQSSYPSGSGVSDIVKYVKYREK